MSKYRIVKRQASGIDKPTYALMSEYFIKQKRAMYYPTLAASSPAALKRKLKEFQEAFNLPVMEFDEKLGYSEPEV